MEPQKKQRRVRPAFVVALGVALVIGGALGVRTLLRYRAYKAQQAELLRKMALGDIEPGPLPHGLPIVGDTNPGPDGYALAHVDKVAIRSLFWHRKYAELTSDFEQLQDAFESDPRKEYWPIDAGDAFDSADATLTTKLDEWVAASPDSFAPIFARANHELSVAWSKRGNAYARDTPAANLRAMEAPLSAAQADFQRALSFRPKLVAAYRGLIQAAALHGRTAEKQGFEDRATTICPACFQVRVTYLMMGTPRWGGSYADMTAFARSAPVTLNPRLRLLEGYVDVDRADLALMDEKFSDAHAAIERAIKLGEHWEFHYERARIRQNDKDPPGALADFERAEALRPGMPQVAVHRAWTLQSTHRNEDAGNVLLDALRIDPTDATAREIGPYILANLDWEAWQAFEHGHRDEALRKYDVAVALAPTQRDLVQRRAWVIVGGDHPDIAGLQAAAAEHPDDLRLHQQLDYSLAQKRRFPEVVAMWTDYLSRHPEDATAYRERAGAYHNMRDEARARADAAKACELGDSEGCLHAH